MKEKKSNRILGTVCARGGSKGIKNKKEVELLYSLNILPRLKIKNHSGEITLFCFKYGVGYSFANYKIVWPNVFLGITDNIVLPSNKLSTDEELEGLNLKIQITQLDNVINHD